MRNYIPCKDSLLELARKVHLDGLRNFHPELSRSPDSSHLRATDSRGESPHGSTLTGMRVSPEQNHSWDDVILKKMLVRNASLYKPDGKFLDELSHQVMKIGNLLIWSGKRMINHEMDLRWVPDSRDPHLAENFDREGSRAVLSHG